VGTDLVPEVIDQEQAGFQVAVQHERGCGGPLLDLGAGSEPGEVTDGQGPQLAGRHFQPRAVVEGYIAEGAGQVEDVGDQQDLGQYLGYGDVLVWQDDRVIETGRLDPLEQRHYQRRVDTVAGRVNPSQSSWRNPP
jgi:hypothetical protein